MLDWLVDDLGATIFRLDAYGKSNWPDPDNSIGPDALKPQHLNAVYKGRDFANAAAVCRYLNGKNIEPYITLSGVVPAWMCGSDGKTLVRFDLFADMAVSYLEWLRKEQGVRFSLFGPLNETNLGPPEWPLVDPANYVKAVRALIQRLDEQGMDDVRLVIAEEGGCTTNYLEAFDTAPELAGRVAAWGMHCYNSYPDVSGVVDHMRRGPF